MSSADITEAQSIAQDDDASSSSSIVSSIIISPHRPFLYSGFEKKRQLPGLHLVLRRFFWEDRKCVLPAITPHANASAAVYLVAAGVFTPHNAAAENGQPTLISQWNGSDFDPIVVYSERYVPDPLASKIELLMNPSRDTPLFETQRRAAWFTNQLYFRYGEYDFVWTRATSAEKKLSATRRNWLDGQLMLRVNGEVVAQIYSPFTLFKESVGHMWIAPQFEYLQGVIIASIFHEGSL